MIYPGTNSYGMGGDDQGAATSLEDRKKQLLQRLMQAGARNQTGLTGLHAMPLFGGGSHSASDLPTGAMPQLTFNPFLAMAASRPLESFQAPSQLIQQLLAQQQGQLGQQGGGDAQAAANAQLGAGLNTPGVDGPSALPSPPQALGVQQGYLPNPGLAAGRHLADGGTDPFQLAIGTRSRLGSNLAL